MCRPDLETALDFHISTLKIQTIDNEICHLLEQGRGGSKVYLFFSLHEVGNPNPYAAGGLFGQHKMMQKT